MGSQVAHSVLHTTELLEAILLGLDMRTLLLSQRVNKTFGNVIKGSLDLQRVLWVIPDPNIAHSDLPEYSINPLIMQMKTYFGLVRASVEFPTRMLDDSTKDYATMDLHFGSLSHLVSINASNTGSWRNMLLMQTHDPRNEWYVSVIYQPPFVKKWLAEAFEEPVTLGDLVDNLVEDYGHLFCETCPRRIREQYSHRQIHGVAPTAPRAIAPKAVFQEAPEHVNAGEPKVICGAPGGRLYMVVVLAVGAYFVVKYIRRKA